MRAIRAGLATLLAVVLAAPTLAQEPARSSAARAEVTHLEVALRLESIERALASIVTRLEKVAPDKVALVKKVQPTEAFARKHVGSEVETVIAELFPENRRGNLTAEDLKVDLSVYRGWRSGWRIRAVDGVPSVRTGFAPERTRGYPAEVAAIDNRAPHSMGDLPDYLADRFTSAALERMLETGRMVELHVGSEKEALADLKNRGWNVFGEVRAPNGTYERLFLAENAAGEVRYVVSGDVDGQDRVRHLAALLRFAGKKGLPANQLEIVGNAETVKSVNVELLKTGFERLAGEGTIAMIGFRMAMRNELTKRALARGAVEYLRETLGADPYEGLKSKLAAEGETKLLEEVSKDRKLEAGLRVSPRDAFTSSKSLKTFLDAEKALVELAGRSKTVAGLVADEKVKLPGGGRAVDFVASRAFDTGPLHADELRGRTAEGTTKSVLLVNNYYGDAMSSVVRALLETGRSKIAYFGTAGGTAPGVKIGDIHVPGEIYDFEGRRVGASVENALAERLAANPAVLGERLTVGTRLVNVFSPASETMEWLENVRSRNIHAVEVENSHLVSEIERWNARGGKATFYSSVIISDLPGSAHTLGSNNGLTSSTFGKMVDVYLEALGIEGLELRRASAEERSRPFARTEAERRALELADKLVPRELAKSSFLRDRIATILNGIWNAALDAFGVEGKKVAPSALPGIDDRTRAELQAEVVGAYNDKALAASLERANAVVSLLAGELAKRHPGASYELRVGGGIERGLYSPARGLTLEVAGDPAVSKTAAALLDGVRAQVEGAPVVRLGPAGPNAVSLGRGAVFAAEPEPLVRLHASRALSERGVVTRASGSADYVAVEHRRPAFEEVAGLSLGELMVRARRDLGRDNVPTNRMALLSLLTGLDATETAKRNEAWRATQPKVESRGLVRVLEREKERVRDRVRVR